MPTLKGGYHLKDGTRVPSVTTILSPWHPEGIEGLLGWANKLGREGKSHREERDKAADIGTLAHAMVEAHIHGKDAIAQLKGVADDIAKRSFSAFEAYREWAEQTKLQVTHTELPLVSEKYRFGGTFDAILIGNRRAMGDWKSSNAVHATYLCQIAAYGKLWEENYPAEPIDGGYALLRFDKTYGDFSHRWWDNLDTAWKAFLHLRELYDAAKELRARVK